MEQNRVIFQGIMPALVSCIDENENVLENSMRRLMNWHLSEGVTGFYLTGGTGEGPVLQKQTRMKIAEIAKDEMNGRGKLIAHVGAVDLKTAVELARHAGQIGLDAVSSVPPFFFHYGEAEIRNYYQAIADAAGLPVIMYASPLSGVQITWDMVDRFMDIPEMAGVKWTSYDYYTMHRIKSLRGGNINVINGPDECLLCGLVMGADGGIGATYNVMPKVLQTIYESYRRGDYEAAKAAQFQANRLIDLLLQYGVVCGIKDILGMIGYDCGYQVYPQKRFSQEEQARFRKALKDISYEELYI